MHSYICRAVEYKFFKCSLLSSFLQSDVVKFHYITVTGKKRWGIKIHSFHPAHMKLVEIKSLRHQTEWLILRMVQDINNTGYK